MRRRILAVLLILWCAPLGAQSTKARTFNGSSDSLQSASSISLTGAVKITLSFWLWQDAWTDDDCCFIMETDADWTSSDGNFLIYPRSNNSKLAISFYNSQLDLWEIARPSAAAWHHYMIVIDPGALLAALRCIAYVDGSVVTVTEVINNGASAVFGNHKLNVMSRNAASIFDAGRMSMIAIWKDTVLSSGNAISLAACADALTIGTPDFYWPIKQVSPETPDAGAVNLTVNGTSNSNSACSAATPAKRGTLTGVLP